MIQIPQHHQLRMLPPHDSVVYASILYVGIKDFGEEESFPVNVSSWLFRCVEFTFVSTQLTVHLLRLIPFLYHFSKPEVLKYAGREALN